METGKEGEATLSVHLNSPRNIRPSVVCTRRLLNSREERKDFASAVEDIDVVVAAPAIDCAVVVIRWSLLEES